VVAHTEEAADIILMEAALIMEEVEDPLLGMSTTTTEDQETITGTDTAAVMTIITNVMMIGPTADKPETTFAANKQVSHTYRSPLVRKPLLRQINQFHIPKAREYRGAPFSGKSRSSAFRYILSQKQTHIVSS